MQNHRRRIITPQLLAEYAFLLTPGGRLYTATDVPEARARWPTCLILLQLVLLIIKFHCSCDERLLVSVDLGRQVAARHALFRTRGRRSRPALQVHVECEALTRLVARAAGQVDGGAPGRACALPAPEPG